MSFVLAFAGFAVLIILHEAGHFAAAKAVGMRVERFFLFFPPKLISRRIGETEYGIGAIPLGGFVKITGMNPEELEAAEHGERIRKRGLLESIEGADPGPETPAAVEGPDPLPPEVFARAYYNQPVWKRIVVIGAGPAVNIAIAFAILFALAFGIKEAHGPGLEVAAIEKGSPAEGTLQVDDRLISIDGVTATHLSAEDRAERLRDLIGAHKCADAPTAGCPAASPARIVVERDGKRVPVTVTPEYDTEAKRTLIGFRFQAADLAATNPAPPEAARIAADQMWFVASRTIEVIARIFESEKRKEISGVVGSYEVTRQAFEFDARTALTLLAVISLSLGLINLFPFLPLDGGHIFWSLVEKVRGRRVPFSVMERASVVGFMLVILLFFIGLSNDIGRLSGEGFEVR